MFFLLWFLGGGMRPERYFVDGGETGSADWTPVMGWKDQD
jgi:hypothetical protein